jgi:acetyl esterase/lipase
VLKDIIYCTVDAVDLKLDIYRPNARIPVRPAPVVVYVHGGIWSHRSKRDIRSYVDINQLNRNGFLVASVDFRLAPKYKFPAMIVDVKGAVRYLRANAEAYHINPDTMAALGISTGGTWRRSWALQR